MLGYGKIMNNEDRYKIVSNDYADLLLEYNNDMNRLINYPNYSYNLIDRKYAVVHIPVSEMTPNAVYKFGYSLIPKCYGLVTSPGSNSSGFCRIHNEMEYDLRGQGVLVGFVDTGIDYTNQVFKHSDGTSRIISIWDQTIDSVNPPQDFYYGSVFSLDQINVAIKSDTPLDIVPSTDDIGHGTMLAGIAAGSNVVENGFMGIVPDAELVIVKLKQAKQYLRDFFFIPDEAICYQENDIMFGVKYLLQIARRLKRPIAICIGIGTTQDGHDGHSFLSKYLSLSGNTAGTVVVTAAGNEGNLGHHYYGEINPSVGFENVELNVQKNNKGFSMQLWGTAPNIFIIDIYAPTGEFVARIPSTVGQRRTIQLFIEDTSILVDNQTKEIMTGAQLILFRFRNPIAGIWIFQIRAEGDLPLNYHIWLPMEGFISEGTFFLKSDSYTTITSPGNADVPITITSYNHITQRLYYNASKGNTRLDEPKPDLASPGVNVYCPTIGNQFVRSTGSSIAAAHATGVSAMLLEWGILRGHLTIANSITIKRLLIKGAKRDPLVSYPNPDWGYGILDINSTCEMLQNSAEVL